MPDEPIAGFENVDMSQLGLSPTGAPLPFTASDEPPVEPEPEPEPTEEPETEPEVEPEPEPEPEAEPEPVDPSATVELPDGTTITLERARQLAAMELAFRTTPDAERRIAEALAPQQAQQQVQPQPQPQVETQPPPDLDLDDPTSKYLWDQAQAQRAELAALRDTIAKQNATQASIQQQQVETGYASARNNVAQRYGLNPDELAHVESTAARVANLQGLITEEGGSIERAAVRAMEIGIASDPQMRNRLVQPKDTAQDKTRKTKLSALAGTSGSAPRTEPATPLTNQQKVEAMAADIARAVSGQQV